MDVRFFVKRDRSVFLHRDDIVDYLLAVRRRVVTPETRELLADMAAKVATLCVDEERV